MSWSVILVHTILVHTILDRIVKQPTPRWLPWALYRRAASSNYAWCRKTEKNDGSSVRVGLAVAAAAAAAVAWRERAGRCRRPRGSVPRDLVSVFAFTFRVNFTHTHMIGCLVCIYSFSYSYVPAVLVYECAVLGQTISKLTEVCWRLLIILLCHS